MANTDLSGIAGLEGIPHVRKIVESVLENWPEHRKIVARSLGGRDDDLMEHTEEVARIVDRVAANEPDGLSGVMDDYRYLCEKIMVPEEWYFRRHNRYRLSTFEEANAEVYGRTEVMSRYMRGLLASYVLWLNHTGATHHFTREFLLGLKPESDLLEIGPGHGLLMYFASQSPNVSTLTGWDVSPSSLAMVRASLRAMDMACPFELKERNIFSQDDGLLTPGDRFNATIVLSEVLEHLEQPLEALKVLYRLARPGGRVWINVPANSPVARSYLPSQASR